MSKKEIKLILTYLSEKYNIPYNSLELEINKILMNTSCEYNKFKCNAYIMVNDKKVQCSRSKKKGNFCVTHYKQNEKDILKYGKIDIDKISCKKRNVKNINNDNDNYNYNDNSKKYKNPIDVEYIRLNNTDYLFNPENNYIYDFDTYKKIGKLDNNLNIIKKYKNKHKISIQNKKI